MWEVRKSFRLDFCWTVFSFELFVNNGEQVLSGTLYELPEEAKEISFQGEGIHLQVEKHGLKEIELGAL